MSSLGRPQDPGQQAWPHPDHFPPPFLFLHHHPLPGLTSRQQENNEWGVGAEKPRLHHSIVTSPPSTSQRSGAGLCLPACVSSGASLTSLWSSLCFYKARVWTKSCASPATNSYGERFPALKHTQRPLPPLNSHCFLASVFSSSSPSNLTWEPIPLSSGKMPPAVDVW